VAETAAGVDVDLGPVIRELGQVLERQRLSVGQAVFGAGPVEMAALEWLFTQERTPTELAQRLQVTTASVTGLVDRLTAQNLVTRRPHPRDRRKILVALTDEAQAGVGELFARFSAAMTRAVAHLRPAERHLVADALCRITAEIAAQTTRDQVVRTEAAGSGGRADVAETLHRIHAATAAFARPGAGDGDSSVHHRVPD